MIPIKVVVIDNMEEQLNRAVKGLANAKISCLPILYDSINSIKGVIDEPLKGVRLVFLDINLIGGSTPKVQEVVGPISTVLSELIVKSEEPFALIFWTQHVDFVEQLKQMLADRYPDTPVPFVIGAINKNLIPDEDPEEVDKFLELLKIELDKVPLILSLITWESQCDYAAAKTISNLFKIACPATTWNNSEDNSDSVSKLLAKIAIETVGERNIEGKEISALLEGLAPIHLDSLVKMIDEDCLAPIKSAVSQGLPLINDESIDKAALNSFYHIDEINKGTYERGCFIKVDYKNNDFKKLIKYEWNDLFNEFYNQESYKQYADSMKEKGESKIKIKDIRNVSQVGLIEVSPVCDYAQNKRRNDRYLLSVLIPNEYSEILSPNGNHEGIYSFPPISYDGNEYSLRVNYRYVIGTDSSHEMYGEPLFRIREQILNDLTFRYAKYASRPGIISFR